MSLVSLGWSEAFKFYDSQIDQAARIIAIHRSHLRAITSKGEINLHHSSGFSDAVAVGDWVIITPLFTDEQNQPAALIKELIPRKSKISRVSIQERSEEQLMAANIDTVFVVTSANQDFNFNRLQRYLLLIKQGLARPVVILSKVDLISDSEQVAKSLKQKLGQDIELIATSSLNKVGLDQVKELMPPGSTSVFIGSSGVGKSSLVNQLLGQDIQAVKQIREDDDKGRHATTSRELFFIPNGGMIIDTPGIRDVSVFGSEDNLSETFSEIEDIILKCKYTDCTHSSEPGCAIIKALKSQELEQKQWDNYIKLSKEIAFNNNKLSKELASNTKKRWKKINKDYKAKKKFKGSGNDK